MDDKDLLKSVTEKANQWLGEGYDDETRAEVKRMLESEDKNELIDSFYRDLEFGTGGLRGIMGAGSNRMNIYTVGMATQGFANYLKKNFAQIPLVRLTHWSNVSEKKCLATEHPPSPSETVISGLLKF